MSKNRFLPKFPGWLKAVFGPGLVLILVAVLAVILNLKTAQTQTSPGNPTPSVFLPLISRSNQADSMEGWKTYTDAVAGFSFRHPEEWVLTEDSKEGYLARIRPEPSRYHRSISFSIETTSELTAAGTDGLHSFSLQRLKEYYGEYSIKSADITLFNANNVSGIHVTNFPLSAGAHTQVFFAHGNKVVTATLVVGGSDGGISQYDWPTSDQDYNLFIQILNTVEFTER